MHFLAINIPFGVSDPKYITEAGANFAWKKRYINQKSLVLLYCNDHTLFSNKFMPHFHKIPEWGWEIGPLTVALGVQCLQWKYNILEKSCTPSFNESLENQMSLKPMISPSNKLKMRWWYKLSLIFWWFNGVNDERKAPSTHTDKIQDFYPLDTPSQTYAKHGLKYRVED